MHRQKGSRKEPDLPWLVARPMCCVASITPGLKSGIHLIAGRPLGIRERTARERKGDAARIDGSSMNAVRQRKSISIPRRLR